MLEKRFDDIDMEDAQSILNECYKSHSQGGFPLQYKRTSEVEQTLKKMSRPSLIHHLRREGHTSQCMRMGTTSECVVLK